MDTKKHTPRNLTTLVGTRLQGAAPKTRWGRGLGTANNSRPLRAIQGRGYGNDPYR
jgi:hypothetical protein